VLRIGPCSALNMYIYIYVCVCVCVCTGCTKMYFPYPKRNFLRLNYIDISNISISEVKGLRRLLKRYFLKNES
jgi:hypothetical protein